MPDAVAGFYAWLVVASLRLCIVLPLVLAVGLLSRKSSSRAVCALLAAGLFAGLAASFSPALFKIIIPALGSLKAFGSDLPPELRNASLTLPSIPVPGSVPGANPDPLPTLLLWLWAAGAFAMLLLRGWQYCAGLLRFARARPVHPDHPAALLLKRLSEGTRRQPWMFEDERVISPVIHGFFHPRLLVSPAFLLRDAATQEMVLRHELEHLRRHDVLVRSLLEIAAAVFWFHPLVHLLLRQYDQAVEMACDDAVLASGVPASRYGETLVEEAKDGRMSRRQVREVRRRLLAILHPEKSRSVPTAGALAAMLLLFLLTLSPAVVTGFSPYPEQERFQPLEPDPRLAALWRLRIGRGDIVDDWSGYNHHGRINGATWVRDPQRGFCLSFDGKNDILILPGLESDWTFGPLTLAMWLKMPKGADGGGLLLRGDFNQTWCSARAHMGNGIFQVFGERELSLTAQRGPGGGASTLSPGRFPTYDSFGISDEQAPVELPEDRWVHLAFSLNPAGQTAREIRFYIDGELVHIRVLDLVTAPAFNHDWPTEAWYFGRGEAPPVHGNHFEGLLSDLAVFRVALTKDQIRQVMGGNFHLAPEGKP